MKSIQLYRILQDTVGKLNSLAVRLYDGKIDTEDAADQAHAVMKAAQRVIKPKPETADSKIA